MAKISEARLDELGRYCETDSPDDKDLRILIAYYRKRKYERKAAQALADRPWIKWHRDGVPCAMADLLEVRIDREEDRPMIMGPKKAEGFNWSPWSSITHWRYAAVKPE